MTLAERIRAARVDEPKVEWVRRPEVLLCQNIPKPLHEVAPRSVLGSKWWDETRQAAYASTDYHCVACGIHKLSAAYHQWLEGHELYEIDYAAGKMIYLETVALCNSCHNFVHDGRLRALLDSKKINLIRYTAILRHGEQVLKEAGLSRLAYNERDNSLWLNGVAAWKDWRLIIDVVVDGKQVRRSVPPKYKTPEEWKRAMEDKDEN
jgi:hypothetical protein